MKKVISYFISIILAIFLIVSVVLIVTSNTILNCDFILSILNKNDYYGLLDTEIKSDFEGYIKQSGFDNEIFENIYSKEKLKADMENVIKATYGLETVNIDTESIKTNLENNIEKYLSENNISLNSIQQQSMQEYTGKIVEIYEKKVTHPVYLDGMKVIINQVTNIIDSFSYIIYSILGGLALIIIILNIKEIHNAMKYIAISILTAAFFILIGILILKFRINIENILVLNTNFTLIIINIIKEIIKSFINIGISMAGVSVLMIGLGNIKNSY